MSGKILRAITTLFFATLGAAAVEAAPSSSAVNAANAWADMNKGMPGVYRTNDFVFAAVAFDREGSTSLMRRRAVTEVAEMLFAEARKDVEDKLSKEDRQWLDSRPGRLSLPGHVIVQGDKGGIYRYVFAVRSEDFKNALTHERIQREVSEIKARLPKEPEAYGSLYGSYKQFELQLLSQLARYNGPLTNIATPPVSLRAYADAAPRLYEARDRLIKTLSETEHHALFAVAMDCTDRTPDFLKALGAAKIKTIPAGTLLPTPISRRIEVCHGFVRFDDGLSADEPRQMPLIRKLFEEGHDLPLATHLLLAAVDASPRSPRVWEYLSAAADAAGNRPLALLSARVWYALDTKHRMDAMKSLLQENGSPASKAVSDLIH